MNTTITVMNWYVNSRWDGNTKHVALHIRHGHVNQYSGMRWLHDSVELKCAEYVLQETRSTHSGCIQLHIMSEGKEDDFSSFNHLHPIFYLSKNT